MINVKLTGNTLTALKFVKELKDRKRVGRGSDLDRTVRWAARDAEREAQERIKSIFAGKNSTGRLGDSFRSKIKVKTSSPVRLTVAIGSELPYARIQDQGGTITAKRTRYLAIPLTPNAKRKRSPRSFGSLFPIKTRTGKILLARKGGSSFKPEYVLKRSVRIRPTNYLNRVLPQVRRRFILTLEKGIANLVRQSAKKAL